MIVLLLEANYSQDLPPSVLPSQILLIMSEEKGERDKGTCGSRTECPASVIRVVMGYVHSMAALQL